MDRPELDWPALFGRRALGVRLGLEVVEGVFAALDRPAGDLPAIHVVGTNGKGSTAAMAAHALQRHGRRVGLYTSPHLRRVGERVRIDGTPIDDDALLAHVHRVAAAETVVRDAPRPLTFFELLTLAAMDAFAAAGCDTLVVEAGLGGRLDATRVVAAAAIVVTSIGLDHTEWLGDTLAAIAAEKAGVFAPGVPVFAAPAVDEVADVLRAHAAGVGVEVQFVPPRPSGPPQLRGVHQAHNAALALAAARVLEPAVEDADLDGVVWPGRLQRREVGVGVLWLDVAHNLEGIEAACAALRGTRIDEVVFGCMEDKPHAAMRQTLAALQRPVIEVGFGPGAFASAAARPWADVWAHVQAALGRGAHVLMCGSVRLVGAALAELDGEPPPQAQDPVRSAERDDGVFGDEVAGS